MTMLYVPVRYGNLLRLAKSVTATSADAAYPVTNAYDLQPERPARAANTNGQWRIEADLDHYLNTNPSFDSWSGGQPVGWTKVVSGAGAVTQENTIKHSGASSVKFTRATNAEDAYIYADFPMPSSSLWSGSIWAQDGGPVLRVKAMNLQTANYQMPDSFLNLGSGAFAQNDLFSSIVGSRMPIEPYSATRVDLPTIRLAIGLFNTGSGPTASPCYVDDITFYPTPTFASLHWHNIPAGTTSDIQSSPDNSIWTTRATLSMARDRSYITWSPQNFRYWRLRVDRNDILGVGSNANFDVAPYIGELVFGQPLTLLKDARDLKANWIEPQNRAGVGGAAFTFRRTGKPHRELELSWFHTEELASYEQMRDDVYRRLEGGEQPLVLTWGTDAEEVVFGHLAEEIQFPRATLPHYDQSLKVTESVPPLVP